MIENLPRYISTIFTLTTIAGVMLFYRALKNSSLASTREKSGVIITGIFVWLVVQAVITLKNFYNTDLTSMPPKILLFGIAPPILLIIYLFSTNKGRQFVDSLPIANLTYLHIIRIPVELVLLWLSLHKAVPQIMTFEGHNFDVISGITAPFVAFFGLIKNKLSRQFILAWNLICLALLANVVVTALLSVPSPLQKLAFDQPNIAILNFPFSWLPTFIVPVVLFAHLASIRQLMKGR